MNLHLGTAALPPHKLVGLQQAVVERCSGIKLETAQYVHFYDSPEMSDSDSSQLGVLLDYGLEKPVISPDLVSLTVVPRTGTISAWSSKATDILKSCGLEAVGRVERGVRYYFSGVVGAVSYTHLTLPTKA